MNRLFVVFGSDSRFRYTAGELRLNGYEVCMFDEIKPSELSSLRLREKALVLPLPFSRDKRSLNLPSLPFAVTLKGVLSLLREGDYVFGGMLSEEFTSEVTQASATAYDYYDENMINANAVLTAEALIKLLGELKFDESTLKFAVTGFGRTARAIAKAFSDNGTDFFITARGEKSESAAKSMNYDFVKLESFTEETCDYDVIINTVPAVIFDGDRLSALKSGVPIIDIASAPFGVTQSDADKYGVTLVRALALPGKYFPDKAGVIIAQSIIKFLKGR